MAAAVAVASAVTACVQDRQEVGRREREGDEHKEGTKIRVLCTSLAIRVARATASFYE